MRYVRNILKISLVLLLLMLCVGSIYAADNHQSGLASADDDDFDLDEDLDDDSDWDDDLDEDLDDNLDEDLDDNLDEDLDDDVDFDDKDLDDEDDFDIDDDDDWDIDDDIDDDDETDEIDDLDEDYNESDYGYSDFDFLQLKIIYYLDRYGNCSSHNWTESEEFLNEYQLYLLNTSEYRLNESAEGYKTYLKIFDSITSTFGDYNLTENETEYLKFMVIFYLNHYGNVSANYTWNESEGFENFTPPIYLLGAVLDTAKAIATSAEPIKHLMYNNIVGAIYSPAANNSTDLNKTAGDNGHFDMQMPYYGEGNLLILLLVFVIMIFMIL